MEGLKQKEAMLLRDKLASKLKEGKIATVQAPQLRHFPGAEWQVAVHIAPGEEALQSFAAQLAGLDKGNVLIYNPHLVEDQLAATEIAA